MIRIVALACGLLCGAGFAISGLHDPVLLQRFLMPEQTSSLSLGLGLVCAIIAAGLVMALSGNRNTPLLGGEIEPLPGGTGWRPLVSALVFGLGWGLSGYFPLTAMVSAGMLSSGASVFLISVLGGMILTDVLSNGGRLKRGGRGSFG